MDQFLFPYIEQIVSSGRKVNLFLFDAADEEFALQAEQLLSRHVGWLIVQPSYRSSAVDSSRCWKWITGNKSYGLHAAVWRRVFMGAITVDVGYSGE